MTQPLTQPRPFIFDTEFAASGEVVRGATYAPVKRAFNRAEVDALLAQAQVEARQAALAEVDSIRALALAEIGRALAASAPVLKGVAERHRADAAGLALSAARVIAGAALDRYPQGALKAALETLAEEIDASPRLTVRAAGLDEVNRAEIERLCAEAGFDGMLSLRDEPGMAPAAFALEWADGRAAFDPAEVEARIRQAVATALAVEAGHAETLSDGAN